MDDKKYFYKLGENIRGLRRFFNETQADLAAAIGVNANTISNYEMGERIPERTAERDCMARIATHYMITEDELLNGDYSTLGAIKGVVSVNFELKKALDKTFPLVYSEEAMADENFKMAFNLHMSLYHSISCGEDIPLEEIEKCESMYKQAREENVIEAAANMLWCIMLVGVYYNTINSRIIDVTNSSYFCTKSIIEMLLPRFSNNELDEEIEKWISTKRRKFYDSRVIDTMVNIRLLKLSNKYLDLGDYYFALGYMAGLIPNHKTKEMNLLIGSDMMTSFAIQGNEYAKRYFGEG